MKEKVESVIDGKHERGVDEGVFGRPTIRLRNFTGSIAVLTVCFTAIVYAFTVQTSVSHGGIWPDWKSQLIMLVGPIMISWSYMDVSKILRIITQSAGTAEILRKRAVSALSRPGDFPQQQPGTQQVDPNSPPPPMYNQGQ